MTNAAPLSLTALLDSLHTNLQTQTQVLPTLHAQLGLPETALNDEFAVLHAELTETVERRVDTRRKEVDSWMVKCSGSEQNCLKYTNALAGNAVSSGTSLGEIRKEVALPKRYNFACEYQEKLRQLYHTKLEQLTSLTNRVNALAQTLGADFYPKDLLEVQSVDDDQLRDVAPERYSRLEKELVRGRAEVNKRLGELEETFVRIDWLHAELGSGLPDSEDRDADPFLEPSTPTPIPGKSLNRSTLHPVPSSSQTASQTFSHERIFTTFIRTNQLVNVEPTIPLLAWAHSTLNNLTELQSRREAHIQTLYDSLEGLWRRLGVSPEDMDEFVEANRGCTASVVQAYEEELERMMECKRGMMGTFIESAREEIVKYWDDLMAGEDERVDFAPFFDDEHTEELLTLHEQEIVRLKEERRLKAPLLAGIKRYFDICEEERELAAAASDQTRLLGRGPRDPGRLLREEKMRKRVTKEKPRLEQDLLTSIPAWEEENKRSFLVHGERILDKLYESADQENRQRDPKPPRPGSSTRATTPGAPSGGNLGTKPGVVTPAVRPGASNSNTGPPNKRQRLGESTAANNAFLKPTPGGGSSSQQRLPLGVHRGQIVNRAGARSVSPSKSNGVMKPLTASVLATHATRGGGVVPPHRTVGMPVPKPGTSHHGLGHGRLPTAAGSGNINGNGGGYAGSYQRTSSNSRSTTSSSAIGSSMDGMFRFGSSSNSNSRAGVVGVVDRKAMPMKKESFKPRPSCDLIGMGMSIAGRRGPITVTVKEEGGY